jgi:hypothetical protein
MAYDRYDQPREPRGDDNHRWRNERSSNPRWRDDRNFRETRGWNEERGPRDSRDRDERGWFERAGDEIASWFGDDDSERRRHSDPRGERSYGRENYRDSDRFDTRSDYRSSSWGEAPRAQGFFAAGGPNRSRFSEESGRFDRDDRFSSRDSFGSRNYDPHYSTWRKRQMDELDRDYDEYQRENQSRFEDEFRGWREKRQMKRGLLGQAREHMDVVGKDGEHVGTVDRIAGDRLILTKSDADAGGAHHSLSCTDIDRVENNQVVLDCSAEEAKSRWRDESRSRALFEREDQGEAGPRMLDRSFEGTYRS